MANNVAGSQADCVPAAVLGCIAVHCLLYQYLNGGLNNDLYQGLCTHFTLGQSNGQVAFSALADQEGIVKRMDFITTCLTANGNDIIRMVDAARPIKRATFMRRVNKLDMDALADSMGYALHHSDGLTMAQDWHVKYYRSKYRGKPCYFLDWSGIEHVFA